MQNRQMNMNELDKNKVIAGIEAILFSWAEPITMEKIADILDVSPQSVEEGMEELMERTQESNRGICILKTGDVYQMATKASMSGYLDKLFGGSKQKGLSNASLEVLSIVALKQPITRAEIEEIRGVNSDGALNSLLQRELVMVSGRLDKIGKPQTFSTTVKFLQVFGMESLDELPSIDELSIL